MSEPVGARLVTSKPGVFNFQELLEKLRGATNVVIATYGLGYRWDRNPVLNALRQKIPGGHITFVVCVPNRRIDECALGADQLDEATQRHVAALDAKFFPCPIDVWFCFENHAKILIADSLAYVGSANPTRGSGMNFEAGYITDDVDDLEHLESFVAGMREKSVPLSVLQASRECTRLLAFAAQAPQLLEAFESCSCKWIPDITGDGEFVVDADQLCVPESVVNAVDAARRAAECIEPAMIDSSVAPELPAMVKSVTDRLLKLSGVLDEIDSGSTLTEKLNETAVHHDLLVKHLPLSNDGLVDATVTLAANAELGEKMDENRDRREREAGDCYVTIKEMLGSLPGDIRVMLQWVAINPRLRQARPKFPSE